jgi:hypothetical protein
MGHWFTGEVNKALSSPPQLHSHCGLSTHVASVQNGQGLVQIPIKLGGVDTP